MPRFIRTKQTTTVTVKHMDDLAPAITEQLEPPAAPTANPRRQRRYSSRRGRKTRSDRGKAHKIRFFKMPTMIAVAKELNAKLGLQPPIDITVRYPMTLRKYISQTFPLIKRTDKLTARTWQVLAALGLTKPNEITHEEAFRDIMCAGGGTPKDIIGKLKETFPAEQAEVEHKCKQYLNMLLLFDFVEVSADGERLRLCARRV
jgi:hypothetical protein